MIAWLCWVQRDWTMESSMKSKRVTLNLSAHQNVWHKWTTMVSEREKNHHSVGLGLHCERWTGTEMNFPTLKKMLTSCLASFRERSQLWYLDVKPKFLSQGFSNPKPPLEPIPCSHGKPNSARVTTEGFLNFPSIWGAISGRDLAPCRIWPSFRK